MIRKNVRKLLEGFSDLASLKWWGTLDGPELSFEKKLLISDIQQLVIIHQT